MNWIDEMFHQIATMSTTSVRAVVVVNQILLVLLGVAVSVLWVSHFRHKKDSISWRVIHMKETNAAAEEISAKLDAILILLRRLDVKG